MAKSKHFYIRKTHRYLGVILGIQFFMWTIGGLYFSWTNIDEIHGDFQKKEAELLSSNLVLISPAIVLENINKKYQIDSINSIQLVEILGKPFYQVHAKNADRDSDARILHLIADATSGELRQPLTKEEAVLVATKRFNGDPKIESVEYLTAMNTHHEYRENPLPAYAVTFSHPSKTTVYVAAELGTVQKFRNNKWRIFDFLFMMHTMDYQSRDNFNNILLRIFSLFGLITIISGFTLFFVSSKSSRKRKQTLRATNQTGINL
jgi:uncharacterized iron-regulated membrane protein